MILLLHIISHPSALLDFLRPSPTEFIQTIDTDSLGFAPQRTETARLEHSLFLFPSHRISSAECSGSNRIFALPDCQSIAPTKEKRFLLSHILSLHRHSGWYHSYAIVLPRLSLASEDGQLKNVRPAQGHSNEQYSWRPLCSSHSIYRLGASLPDASPRPVY